jgi:hypothetical protein
LSCSVLGGNLSMGQGLPLRKSGMKTVAPLPIEVARMSAPCARRHGRNQVGSTKRRRFEMSRNTEQTC